MAIIEQIIETRSDLSTPFFINSDVIIDGKKVKDFVDSQLIPAGISYTLNESPDQYTLTTILTYNTFSDFNSAKNLLSLTHDALATMYHSDFGHTGSINLSGIDGPFYRVITFNFPAEISDIERYNLLTSLPTVVSLTVGTNDIVITQQYSNAEDYVNGTVIDIVSSLYAFQDGGTRTITYSLGTYTA